LFQACLPAVMISHTPNDRHVLGALKLAYPQIILTDLQQIIDTSRTYSARYDSAQPSRLS